MSNLPRERTTVFEVAECFGPDPFPQFWFSRQDPTNEAEIDAFYDQSELIHRINGELCESDLRVLERCTPCACRRS